MSIEIEESIEADAVGSDNGNSSGSCQALAIIVPTTLLRPAAASAMLVPRLIADAGENASLRFLDFFTANIRNPNTRAAYAVATRAFFAWLDTRGVTALSAVRTRMGIFQPGPIGDLSECALSEAFAIARVGRIAVGGRGRVARPFGSALPDPGRRLSRTRLFPEVTRIIPLAAPMGE